MVYTYATARLNKKKRLTRGIEPDMQLEADLVLDIYFDKIIDGWDKLSKDSIIKFSRSIGFLKANGAYDFYVRFLKEIFQNKFFYKIFFIN